ncbi:MAG: DUF1592 domain-containing protein [Pseudomonadota bacterium]
MWNTGPDQQLLDLAAQKRLSDTKVMDAQVLRMLKDPRASALVDNFAMTWLSVDDLGQVEPTDGNTATNNALRANLDAEIRLFLSSVLLEDRSVVDLLTAGPSSTNRWRSAMASRMCTARSSAACSSPTRTASACWARARC